MGSPPADNAEGGTINASHSNNCAGTIPIEDDDDDQSATQMTCDVPCSLSSSCSPPPSTALNNVKSQSPINGMNCPTEKRRTSKTCPKQHQLPMFLSKTYHMIDRCNPDIATWSEAGDNFVVKNVEKFASVSNNFLFRMLLYFDERSFVISYV